VSSVFSLAPDARRALRLDAELRSRLAESLRYVLTEFDLLPVEQIDSLEGRLRRGPVDPQMFGIYYDLVLALENDEPHEALLAELHDVPDAAETLAIRSLDDLRPQARARYQRHMDTDPQTTLRFKAPSPESLAQCRDRLMAALSLLQHGHPELYRETMALLREVVLAVSQEEATLDFEGASSFLLWGSIALNAHGQGTRLATLEALVHESGHSLLFGLSSAQPLLENDVEERHRSPLRQDLRPLDGIFHATFVTARTHQAVTTLLARGVLSDEEVSEAERSLQAHRKAFEEGVNVLGQHAKPTPLGQAVLSGIRDCMMPVAAT
jgi:HEXXH motif-containing protein